jgi:uncharacterized membrane protein YhaH (DUF805 family)
MSKNSNAFWDSLLSPKGRNNRVRYWQVTGLFFVAMLVIGVGASQIESSLPLWIMAPGVAILLLATVLFFVVNVFNQIKRLHDLGRSGWWYLLVVLVYVPVVILAEGALRMNDAGATAILSLIQLLVATAFLVIFGALPGQAKANRFGEPPGAASEETLAEQAA